MPSAKEEQDTAIARAVATAADNEQRAFARGKAAGEASVLYEVEQLRAKLARAASNAVPHRPALDVRPLLDAIDNACALHDGHGVAVKFEAWTAIVNAREALKGAV